MNKHFPSAELDVLQTQPTTFFSGCKEIPVLLDKQRNYEDLCTRRQKSILSCTIFLLKQMISCLSALYLLSGSGHGAASGFGTRAVIKFCFPVSSQGISSVVLGKKHSNTSRLYLEGIRLFIKSLFSCL